MYSLRQSLDMSIPIGPPPRSSQLVKIKSGPNSQSSNLIQYLPEGQPKAKARILVKNSPMHTKLVNSCKASPSYSPSLYGINYASARRQTDVTHGSISRLSINACKEQAGRKLDTLSNKKTQRVQPNNVSGAYLLTSRGSKPESRFGVNLSSRIISP